MTTRAACGLALAGLVLATACSEPRSGPVGIVWGRHACDHCAMAISERRFAAQVRRGPRDVARFDDFGCAVLWLEGQGGPDAATELWVMDEAGVEWLDARRASYRSGERTPMAYGFAALGAPTAGSVDFEEARRAILEGERERASRRRP